MTQSGVGASLYSQNCWSSPGPSRLKALLYVEQASCLFPLRRIFFLGVNIFVLRPALFWHAFVT